LDFYQIPPFSRLSVNKNKAASQQRLGRRNSSGGGVWTGLKYKTISMGEELQETWGLIIIRGKAERLKK